MPEDTVTMDPEIQQRFDSEWEAAGFSNDFIFCKVMQDEKLLAELVRLIHPQLKFTKLVVQSQKSIEEGLDIHGVRFDIFALDDEGNAVEIEMQVQDTGSIPKRMRYYCSINDMQMLEKGVTYGKLKDSYVIVISLFDQYECGLHKYTFTYRCHEKENLEMGDGTTKIFLNAVGTEDDVSGGLKAFLDYVAGKRSDDPFVQKLESAVKLAKANKVLRREYMTLFMRDLVNQEKGMQQGIQQGIEKGREEERKKNIEEMLRKGKRPEEIVDFCGYSITLVKSVHDSISLASKEE